MSAVMKPSEHQKKKAKFYETNISRTRMHSTPKTYFHVSYMYGIPLDSFFILVFPVYAVINFFWHDPSKKRLRQQGNVIILVMACMPPYRNGLFDMNVQNERWITNHTHPLQGAQRHRKLQNAVWNPTEYLHFCTLSHDSPRRTVHEFCRFFSDSNPIFAWGFAGYNAIIMHYTVGQRMFV